MSLKELIWVLEVSSIWSGDKVDCERRDGCVLGHAKTVTLMAVSFQGGFEDRCCAFVMVRRHVDRQT